MAFLREGKIKQVCSHSIRELQSDQILRDKITSMNNASGKTATGMSPAVPNISTP